MENEKKKTTEELIATSFKNLVNSQPIDKITIKEITDGAGLIRPTFYNHFQDKYELLEWIIMTELITPVKPLFNGGFFQEGMTLIFSNMIRDKDFYTHAAKLDGQNTFSSIVQALIERMILEYINEKLGPNVRYHDHEWMGPDMIAEYYARSIRFIIIRWARNNMSIPPREMALVCEGVFESNLEEIMKEMI